MDQRLLAGAARDQREASAFHLDAARRAFDAGRDPETIRELQRALYLTPYDSDAHLLLGRVHWRARTAERRRRRVEDRDLERRDGGGARGARRACCCGCATSTARAAPPIARWSLDPSSAEAAALRRARPRRPRRGRVIPSDQHPRAMPMTTPDEGFREIQLNGKQLVFLFMAVTVVSVVIFLCGVLVGRGVQARSALVDAPVDGGERAADDAGAPPALAADAPTPRADVSFPERLGDNATPKEKLVAAKEPLAPAAAAVPASAPAPAPTRCRRRRRPTPAPPRRRQPPAPPAAPAPAAKVAAARATPGIPTEPTGAGFAIQVAALRQRAEAEAIVARLGGKGYPAYVVTPAGRRAAAVPRARRQVQGARARPKRSPRGSKGRAVQALDYALAAPRRASLLRALVSRATVTRRSP